MSEQGSFYHDLSFEDIEAIESCAVAVRFDRGRLVFAEGDLVDSFYIIASGRCSIFFNKQGRREDISVLGPGDYFGEMAIFNRSRRLASVMVLEDSELLAIDKDKFLQLVRTHPGMAEKINRILARRNEELILKENLIDTTGISGRDLHISIKGDPSIRETAFYRDRYESVVDKILPALVSYLENLLLQRCVYKVFVAFNSGEVRLSSIFDPFNEQIHTADKIIDEAYVDRHFPRVDYQEKSALIRGMYDFVMTRQNFTCLPEHWQNAYRRSHHNWQPLAPAEVSRVLQKLVDLRSIPDFYLRNFSISMIHNAIRMQFNCDGTHIVSTEDYQRFVEENLQPV